MHFERFNTPRERPNGYDFANGICKLIFIYEISYFYSDFFNEICFQLSS